MRPQEPGRYDSVCRAAQDLTEAQVLLLCVIGGNAGDGFSIAVDSKRLPNPEVTLAQIPGILRALADDLEKHGKSGN